MKKVIVTCGGTSEPVDDVRVLTNISTGRFGHALAAALAVHHGYMVTELCPKSTLERLGQSPRVTYEHYRTTDDLRHALLERESSPAVIIQAAAVSDYRPVKVDGKISSTEDSLTITMERTPKILPQLRPTYGSKAFLVGFKLLSGVSEDVLIEAASKQLKDGRLNMVVANDLQKLRDGNHPVLIVTAEGGVFPLDGTREEVAAALAALIVKREAVGWFRSLEDPAVEVDVTLHNTFKATLALAKELNLLTDASGNISVRDPHAAGSLLVSPRGIDKSTLSSDHALPVWVDGAHRELHFGTALRTGAREGRAPRPSIDTGMEAMLYRAYPTIDGIIHFHRGWGRMDAVTAYPYPCGVAEEATEVLAAATAAGISTSTDALSVELVHHGFLLGLTVEKLAGLSQRWSHVLEEFAQHLDEVKNTVPEDALTPLDERLYQPIWDGAHIMGVIHANPDATAVYLTEDSRGTGLGRIVVDQLVQRHHVVQTVNDCHVRDFYKRFGFTEKTDRGVYRLSPPARKLRREFTIQTGPRDAGPTWPW